jgi:hypothetical protein
VVIVAIEWLASKFRENCQNIVPSEVAHFRVLHADHAVGTAGNTSRGLGTVVVHLGNKKNENVKGEEKWKVKTKNKSL